MTDINQWRVYRLCRPTYDVSDVGQKYEWKESRWKKSDDVTVEATPQYHVVRRTKQAYDIKECLSYIYTSMWLLQWGQYVSKKRYRVLGKF